MNPQFDVLVVGGGIVGLTAALSMAERHYSVAVIDAGALTMDALTQDIRVYAINHASKKLLQQLGAWQNLERHRISPYTNMHVWDAVSRASIDFDSRYIAADYLGVIIEESALKKALLQAVATHSNIQLFPNNKIDDVATGLDFVRISSQDSHWDGQLLMIADGANSPTRDKLKVELTSWSYHHNALVATVHTEKNHQNTAYQVFHPDGPLAFLPLNNPNQCSIVWSTHPDQTQKLMKLQEEEFNEQLMSAFEKKLGQVQLVSQRCHFPLRMRHVTHYVGDRWLLLGDAAHTIHPLAGLGLNLGLADIRSWLDCLDSNNRSFFSNKTLGAYQRERKSDVWKMIMLMDGLKRMFGYRSAPITVLRGLGLNICNGLIPIKRFFIQQAAG